ncbi:MAG TPA: DUF1573 domain-containing protein [Cytophagales bacterium]|nr:DUF1573 domain-containing protein [Cytophagales bacterium]HAP58170.1 DUF1573 domain-containing protein [Cytophagales bacterium]
MKKYAFLLMVMALPVMGMAQEAATGAAIEFKEKEFNFGDIHQGDKVEHTFTFTNTGNAPLILSNVLVTCGCTATDWPKEAIPPGKDGEIKVTFNSTGKMGMQSKPVTVLSNSSQGQVQVKLMGNVLPPETDG